MDLTKVREVPRVRDTTKVRRALGAAGLAALLVWILVDPLAAVRRVRRRER